MAESQNQLAVLVQESGLDASKGQVLTSRFADYFTIAQQWQAEAKTLTVTSEDQVELMKRARQGRLVLRQKRVDIEKTRKQLKDDSLKEGRAIDGIAKLLTSLIEPTEDFLREQETFAERAAEKRAAEQAQMITYRRGLLEAYGHDSTDEVLGSLSNEAFAECLQKSRLEYEEKQIQLEAERQRQRQADERSRDELLKENQRLEQERQKEREAARQREQQLQAQLQEQQEQQRQQQAQARRERDLAEQEAQKQRLLMQAAQQEKLAQSSDQEKLLAWADSIEQVQGTALLCTTEHGQKVVANVGQLLTRAAGFLREQAGTLQNQAA